MGPTCAEVTLTDVVDSVRRGGVVRVASDVNANETKSPAGYFVLAAEMASTEAIHRLLRFAEGLPVFATTRDRLELLQIVEVPVADKQLGEVDRQTVDHSWAVDRTTTAAKLAAAAASLIGSDVELAKDALRGLTVRCTDWGGVANCQRIFEAAVDLARMAGLMPAAVIWQLAPERTAKLEPSLHDELLDLPSVLIRQLVDHRRAQMSATLLRNGPPVRMPTRHGNFTLQVYEDTLTGQLHIAFWTGKLRDPALVHVHSECLTGDLFGSLRCDCGTQLDLALARLAQEGDGVLLYLRRKGAASGSSTNSARTPSKIKASTRWRRTSRLVSTPTCATTVLPPRCSSILGFRASDC